MADKAQLFLDPSKNQEVDHVILVELDALLDTRIGVLAQIDPEFAALALAEPGYFTRVSDEFSTLCGVDDETYRAAWAARNEEVLPLSVVTNIVMVLSEVCQYLEQQRLTTSKVKSVTVEINLWPYVLDKDAAFMLESAVAARLPIDVQVRSASRRLEDITLQLVDSVYSGIILYNFADWMQIHAKNFQYKQIPGVTVLVPRLHVSGTKGFALGDVGPGYEHVDPYEAIQAIHAPLLGLEFLSPNMFSIAGRSSDGFANTIFKETGGELTDEDMQELMEERAKVVRQA